LLVLHVHPAFRSVRYCVQWPGLEQRCKLRWLCQSHPCRQIDHCHGKFPPPLSDQPNKYSPPHLRSSTNAPNATKATSTSSPTLSPPSTAPQRASSTPATSSSTARKSRARSPSTPSPACRSTGSPRKSSTATAARRSSRFPPTARLGKLLRAPSTTSLRSRRGLVLPRRRFVLRVVMGRLLWLRMCRWRRIRVLRLLATTSNVGFYCFRSFHWFLDRRYTNSLGV
jgi:hypothetical protein